MLFEPGKFADQKANILVAGVGGAGGNALNRMIEDNLTGVEFIVINTDAQDIEDNNAQIKLQIGRDLTKGLGAGANSGIGKQAAEADREAIKELMEGSDMAFITAGMGGGTGTGAAPVIADIAKECDVLTVGVVTKPFVFEGPKRTKRALEGIAELKANCDTLIVIPNETLLNIADSGTTVIESFKLADSVLHQATRGISDLINVPGLINLDFADVRTVMKDMGDAIMGTGIAQGEERATLAAEQAISSPLLQDVCIKGASGLLVNITGSEEMTLHEFNNASSIIQQEAGDTADIIIGCVFDNSMSEDLRVTVIATGFNKNERDVLDEKPMYTPDFQSRRENYFEENDYNSVPTFQAKRSKKQATVEKKVASENEEKEKEPIYVFEDGKENELDIPTFLRNRRKEHQFI